MFHCLNVSVCMRVKGGRFREAASLLSSISGLDSSDGLAFFDYGDVNTKALRAEFKEKINAMKVDRETKETIIEEKKLVFKMNNEIASQVTLSVKGFARLIKLLLVVILVIAVIVFAFKKFF